jgi:predicted methyltransferase
LSDAAVYGIVCDDGGSGLSFVLPFTPKPEKLLMASIEERARNRARAARGPTVLAAMISGASLKEIAQLEDLPLKRVEKLVRDELRKRWIAPAQDYARLQIARLEAIAFVLKDEAKEGHLPTIDRLLKVLDRLDRYHGFNKLAALSTQSREDVRAKLIARFDQASRKPGPSE